MDKGALFILCVFSLAIWIMVSKEFVKPSKKISSKKMITLLIAGIFSTSVITISLIQNLL